MLKNLRLENFRNHKNFELELCKCTIIVGQNGAGKSNVLESISLLSNCRSFRDDDKKNLIAFGAVFSRVIGDNLEIFITNNPRLILKAKENGAPRKLCDFVGLLPCVIFSPETLSIITGSPGERRKFLDIMISQTDHEYLSTLMEYQKVRKQRNVLLQRIQERQSAANELAFWDDALIKNGEIIIQKRREAIEHLNKFLTKNYQKISGEKKALFLANYLSAADLKEEISKHKSREIAAGITLVGPHRDDISFLLNGSPIANFGSRGEIRTAVLALKIAELHYLETKRKMLTFINPESIQPVLLLDDVFSEFDKIRRELLCELVPGYQSVITTTDMDHISE
jgi:DNA replication and repair protein RecF